MQTAMIMGLGYANTPVCAVPRRAALRRAALRCAVPRPALKGVALGRVKGIVPAGGSGTRVPAWYRTV